MKTSGALAPSLTTAPFGVLQRKCACGGSSATGQCTECNKKEGTRLQRSTIGNQSVTGVSPIVHEVLRSLGQPLDEQTRAFFEPRFGHDFSQVRVHTGDEASRSAEAVDALAYTVGNNVVFGRRQYRPDTTAGCQKRQTLQRAFLSPNEKAPMDEGEVPSTSYALPRIGRDFSRVTSATGVDSLDGSVDEEGEESVNLPMPSVRQPSIPAQAVPLCPVTTRVDNITDLTPAGLQAGFLSAYGIIARMRVLPDGTTWDGRQVAESLTQTSSTCPAGLTNPGPCNGSSTFTIGAPSGGSGVIPQQPAVRNRFYDFHTSRSRTVSFLHDPGRNPTRMNSCETVCRQDYLCNNRVIGTHMVTRRFRKGSFNGRNVTIIDVSKMDNPAGPGDFPIRTLPPGQEYAGLTSEPGEIV